MTGIDNKKLVVKDEVKIKNTACYEYTFGRCGCTAVVPQFIVRNLDMFAPETWRCVLQNQDRNYFCYSCALDIGIGLR